MSGENREEQPQNQLDRETRDQGEKKALQGEPKEQKQEKQPADQKERTAGSQAGQKQAGQEQAEEKQAEQKADQEVKSAGQDRTVALAADSPEKEEKAEREIGADRAKAPAAQAGAAVKDAKSDAAAKRRAAAARRRAAAKKEEEKPKGPSKNQPLLDKYVQVIKSHFGDDVIEEAYINWLAKEVPTLVIKKEKWFEVAQFIKYNEQLSFDYLSNLAGIDHETHMEVYYHFYSYKEGHALAIRVKTDRDNALLPSITPIWAGADWPERETYDLLGIRFEGHPNLERILLTDEWVGHPLRKDYVQYDEEI